MGETITRKFTYRLLASADVIGSTAFKVGKANKSEQWAHVFRAFFHEFPRIVSEEFAKVLSDLVPCGKPASTFQVWKFVGDEVLFSTILERHEHAAVHVLTFKNAIDRYSRLLSEKHKTLALKRTIWGADFPLLNVEVETTVSAGAVKAIDFLGPSVDLGFRLAQFADRRRIPISADVALFLSSCFSHAKANKAIKLLADSPKQLKGVNENIPYPLICIDRRDGEQTAEDKFLGRDTRCRLEYLIDYLSEQFDGEGAPLRRPYIESDQSDAYGRIPDKMRSDLEKILADDPYIAYQRDVNRADPKNAVTIPPPLPSLSNAKREINKRLTKPKKPKRKNTRS